MSISPILIYKQRSLLCIYHPYFYIRRRTFPVSVGNSKFSGIVACLRFFGGLHIAYGLFTSVAQHFSAVVSSRPEKSFRPVAGIPYKCKRIISRNIFITIAYGNKFSYILTMTGINDKKVICNRNERSLVIPHVNDFTFRFIILRKHLYMERIYLSLFISSERNRSTHICTIL